jgi:5-methylcytosine-specific restriction enzyme A
VPSALLRACAAPGCAHLVTSGRCPQHAREHEQYRGTAAERGYDHAWRELTERFRSMLIHAGVVPVCGARLPGAPMTQDSHCQTAGLLVGDGAGGQRLHTDHIVPHRGDKALMWDVLNLQLLCREDHNRKTQGEQQRGVV